MGQINKARYWWSVLYPENMIDDWATKIDEILEIPFAYALHSSDVDTKSEHRKNHIHLIIVFPNTTTYNHALNVFNLLSKPGLKAANTCKACISIRNCYDYLIHDTEACKKADKHLYKPTDRVTGNNFDIGVYEQLSLDAKREMQQEMVDVIVEKRFTNITDFYTYLTANFDPIYFEIFVTNNRLFEAMTRGNYLKYNKPKMVKAAISKSEVEGNPFL